MADEEEEGEEGKKKKKGEFLTREEKAKKEAEIETVNDLINRATVLMSQLNNLYTLYANGIEKSIPFQKRNSLDKIMTTLSKMTKLNQIEVFRAYTVQSRYVTYRERWDRLVRRMENS